MQTYGFNQYYRQTPVAALIELMVFSSMPSWSLSGRATAYSSKVKYAAENAKITAFQETKDGIVHIGRADVINGEAIMPVVQRPVAGAPIQSVAGLDDDVSLKLTR